MPDLWFTYGQAAKTAAGFFWKSGWAFVLDGGVLIGPILILLGLNGIIQSLWSARPRGYREVIEDEDPVER